MKFRRGEVLHEVPEEFEDLAFKPASLNLLVKADRLIYHQDKVIVSQCRPHVIQEHGLERRPRVSKEERTVGNLHLELMVALQAPAD